MKVNNNYNNEPGLSYFIDQIGSSEHTYRMAKVKTIKNHLQRQHKVNERLSLVYNFKGKTFTPAAIVLQGIKTIINFHVAYLVGKPVTFTGTSEIVDTFTKIYKNGLYSKVDFEILKDLITYGNAFEYVYLDANNKIKSKVLRNEDSYPIYDSNNVYKYFVEHWKDRGSEIEHYIIYFPTHVDSYINGRLIESKINYSGLPIHYVALDRAEYDQFGDSVVLDLIPIQDKIEGLLSKLDDAITTLSLNPIGVLNGSKITESDMVDSNIAGAVLNLEDGGGFKYASAEMDYNNIKFELDNLYSQFNLVACVPSGLLGQSNIANVSENSMSMIYQLTENRGRENTNALMEGFGKRWDLMRKLLALRGIKIEDADFESLGASFNTSKPIDTKQNFENMKTQYDMGAISKKTIIENSPYTSDYAQELERLEEEKAEEPAA